MTRLLIRLATLVCAGAALGVPGLATAQGIQGVHVLTKVVDGVYVAEPRFGGANATIVINDDSVAIVDPHSDPATAGALVSEVAALTDKPIRFVINTHWHGDHHGGNRRLAEAFPGQIQFIAHPNTRGDIVAEATPELGRMGGFYATFFDKAEAWLRADRSDDGRPLGEAQKSQIRTFIADGRRFIDELQSFSYHLPDVMVDRELALDAGGRRIVVRHLGEPAHTRGDLVMHLPGERVLILGDLVTAPYVVPRSGYPAGYARTLRAVASLDAGHYVLGHGGPVKRDAALIQTMAGFLEAAAAHAAVAVRAGHSLEATLAAAKTAPGIRAFESRIDWNEPGLRMLTFDTLVAMTVERAYREAEAAPRAPAAQDPGETVNARMERYNRSLGVACAHCHVDGQWTDDSKRPFAIARNMSKMVAVVNERIGGQPKVSCWTCHAGQTRPARQPGDAFDAELARWPADLAGASQGLKITMSVYNVALGVGCDHCHVPGDWANRAKAPNRIVPTMNSLFEIFPTYMPEGARTQCYMCHKGSTRPATSGPSDQRTLGPSDQRTLGPPDPAVLSHVRPRR